MIMYCWVFFGAREAPCSEPFNEVYTIDDQKL